MRDHLYVSNKQNQTENRRGFRIRKERAPEDRGSVEPREPSFLGLWRFGVSKDEIQVTHPEAGIKRDPEKDKDEQEHTHPESSVEWK